MEGGTVGIIQPVAGVKGQKFHFGAVGKIRRFVNHEPSGFDRSREHLMSRAYDANSCTRSKRLLSSIS